jgi:hypothetical protein
MKMKTTALIFILSFGIIAGTLRAQEFYPDGEAEIAEEQEAEETQTPQRGWRADIIYLEQGNFLFGTGIGFSTSDSRVDIDNEGNNFNGDGGTSTFINLSPNLGYFFTDKLALGVGMDFISSFTSGPIDITDPNSPQNTTSNSDVLFGPFVRFYQPVAEDKAFFLTTTLGFGSSKDEFESNNTTQSVNNNIVTLGIGPGFTVVSKGGLALEAIVKYNYARSQSDIMLQGVERSSTTFTNAFDFSIGIQYYFAGFKEIDE